MSCEDMVKSIEAIEELRFDAFSTKHRAGLEFRLRAYNKLLELGYSRNDAYNIASDLWDEV